MHSKCESHDLTDSVYSFRRSSDQSPSDPSDLTYRCAACAKKMINKLNTRLQSLTTPHTPDIKVTIRNTVDNSCIVDKLLFVQNPITHRPIVASYVSKYLQDNHATVTTQASPKSSGIEMATFS